MKNVLVVMVMLVILTGCIGGKGVKDMKDSARSKLRGSYLSYKDSRPEISKDVIQFDEVKLAAIPTLDAKKISDINFAAACLSQVYEASALLTDFYFEDAEVQSFIKESQDIWKQKAPELLVNANSEEGVNKTFATFMDERFETKEYEEIIKRYIAQRALYDDRVKKMSVDAAKTLIKKYLNIDLFKQAKAPASSSMMQKISFTKEMAKEGTKLKTLTEQAVATGTGLGLISASAVSEISFVAIEVGEYTLNISVAFAQNAASTVATFAIVVVDKAGNAVNTVIKNGQVVIAATGEVVCDVSVNTMYAVLDTISYLATNGIAMATGEQGYFDQYGVIRPVEIRFVIAKG